MSASTSRTNGLAIDCACRSARTQLNGGTRHTVLLTSREDVSNVRREVGSVLPPGSRCTGAVWTTPDGQIVSVKTYSEKVPPYPHPIYLEVCNGGRVLTEEDLAHVERWRSNTKLAPIPFPDSRRHSVSGPSSTQPTS